MGFIVQLFMADSVAHAILIFSFVVAFGLMLGSVRVFGVNFGVAGVLFAGIIFGHYGITVNSQVLEFTRELGLILFVYTIGIQVGPGFFSSFKRDGLRLNLMAGFIVLFGAAITFFLSRFADIPLPAAMGLFSGATTNTPSLAAAQQALKEIPGVIDEIAKLPGLGYAVSYPFGIVGIILAMTLTRIIFRINTAAEAETHAKFHAEQYAPLESVDLKVENPNLNGCLIKKIPALNETGIVISRVSHQGSVEVALPDTKIHVGDIIHAVGPKEKLEQLQMIIGSRSDVNLLKVESVVASRPVLVTKRQMAGKTLEELNARNKYGVTITRVSRSEVEFTATPDVRINFADTLTVVGEEASILKFAADMGNSAKELNHPQLVPIFVGLVFGVILGSWPFYLPGMPASIKLGLAGGPLIVAIILSRIGRIGNLIWYMPASANFMLREFGIALFLACVGLSSGDQFIKTLFEGNGFYWMGCAAAITFIPIFIVALFARLKFKLNYMTLCGLLAGSMTDPPALAFANSLSASNAPSVAYATVYPLVMFLRVMAAQIMVIFFMR